MNKNDYFTELPYKEEKRINSCNILEVKVGTTGLCGGDSGHGGHTYFSLEDLGGTDMNIIVDGKLISCSKVEVSLGGDTELRTFIEALEFAADRLNSWLAQK